MDNCRFKNRCSKFKSSVCNELCYAYIFMHGMSGDGGMWSTINVPKKYENFLITNLPEGKPFDMVRQYGTKLTEHVGKGKGLFLYSQPTAENKFGTGNGKTTSAIAILNTYTITQSMRHLQNEIKLTTNPALFVKASDFQNLYNSQFRGIREMQETASQKYYRFKELMETVGLLAIDDIAIRTGTEAFMNEFFEILDCRCAEELATIFTSNYNLQGLQEFYGDRICSRIEGMTLPISFSGKDRRKK